MPIRIMARNMGLRSEYKNALRQIWQGKEQLESQLRQDTGKRYNNGTYANCLYLVQQGKFQDVVNMTGDIISKYSLNANKPDDLYKACAIKYGLPEKMAQIWNNNG